MTSHFLRRRRFTLDGGKSSSDPPLKDRTIGSEVVVTTIRGLPSCDYFDLILIDAHTDFESCKTVNFQEANKGQDMNDCPWHCLACLHYLLCLRCPFDML
ncbi:hypothetical protein Bbelb_103320 [Branchiostoma belcheri]|nr:hypothetical protein Bbelb_103320 [Branchiostoma belcheri]